MNFPEKFLHLIPKTDLHVHLDGSMRIETLIELARRQKVKLPSTSIDGLKKLVFKEKYRNLAEYLHGFKYTCAVLQTPEALEQTAFDLAMDNFNEGVRYIEVRFAPQLHINSIMTIDEVLRAVNKGLERAKRKINSAMEIKKGAPPFEYGIIGCAMRKFGPHFSEYFSKVFSVQPYSSEADIFSQASLALVKALVAVRDRDGIPIVAFDLAGEEKGYPPNIHWPAYQYAHTHFMKKTVHAGEAYGPPSIFQAITELHADRIGHGTHLFHAKLAEQPTQKEQRLYVDNLASYIAEKRITIEVCLTSNMQTMPHLKKISEHPFGKMNAARLSTTFCTDNRTVSNTTVTNEIKLAVDHFKIDRERLKNLIIYGFKRSFYPGSYTAKRHYMRHVIDYYESVERKFFA